jgi:hypothetical protein
MATLSNPLALFGVEEAGTASGRVAKEGAAVSLTSEDVSSFTDSVCSTLGGAFTSTSFFPVFHRRCLFDGSCNLPSPSTVNMQPNSEVFLYHEHINPYAQWIKDNLLIPQDDNATYTCVKTHISSILYGFAKNVETHMSSLLYGLLGYVVSSSFSHASNSPDLT